MTAHGRGKSVPPKVWAGVALVVLALALLPFVAALAGQAWVRILNFAMIYIMLALGLNIVVGFAGLLDLGYIAFYAVGAYMYALLASPHFGIHLPFWVILPLGAGLACIFGVLLGAPTLKLRGDYLAIVTLGFGEIIRIFLNNLNTPVNVTNGPQGVNLIDLFRFGGFSHSAVLLFRQGKAEFEELDSSIATAHDMEVHERIIVDGAVGVIATPLIHEDFKGLTAYIDRHNQYSSWEAGVRFSNLNRRRYAGKTITPRFFGNAQERRRFLKRIAVRMPFESTLWFLYHYVFRLGFLEGRRGLIAAQIRASYIRQARAKLYELQMRREKP